jgi:ribonuclease D
VTNPIYKYIEQSEDLEQLCQSLPGTAAVAVDTEFVRERTFYPHAGLIQLATDDDIYLIDPVACDMSPFLQILENPHICKVMHSISEDMEVFMALGAHAPVNFFDTQIAASWLGAGLSLSLQNLVKTHIGVELSKSETRTNWLKRPLSEAQLSYAAEDVQYLLQIAREQTELLTSTQLIDYVREENKLLVVQPDEDHEMLYLNYGRAATFNSATLNRFQRLISWRERVARRDDKPKPHILRDNDLSSMAVECVSPEALAKFPLHRSFKRRYLDEVSAVLFELSDQPLAPVKRLQDLPQGRQLQKQLKEQLLKIADSKGIPVEVLPSKRILEQIIKSLYVPWYPAPKQWSGWRKSFIMSALETLNVDIVPLEHP